jgi:hypothetical protein
VRLHVLEMRLQADRFAAFFGQGTTSDVDFCGFQRVRDRRRPTR